MFILDFVLKVLQFYTNSLKKTQVPCSKISGGASTPFGGVTWFTLVMYCRQILDDLRLVITPLLAQYCSNEFDPWSQANLEFDMRCDNLEAIGF